MENNGQRYVIAVNMAAIVITPKTTLHNVGIIIMNRMVNAIIFSLASISLQSLANTQDECLLETLKQAAPTTTVQELKDLCALDVKVMPAVTIGEQRIARLTSNSSFITPYNRNYIF